MCNNLSTFMKKRPFSVTVFRRVCVLYAERQVWTFYDGVILSFCLLINVISLSFLLVGGKLIVRYRYVAKHNVVYCQLPQ